MGRIAGMARITRISLMGPGCTVPPRPAHGPRQPGDVQSDRKETRRIRSLTTLPGVHLTVLDSPTEWSRFAEGSIERRMLIALGDHLGETLRPKVLLLPDGNRVEVEGIDPEARVLVQLVSNQGAYKPAYRNKVMADMFKLLWLRQSVPSAERAVLVVTEVIVQALGGWVARAAAELAVNIYVFDGTAVETLRRPDVGCA